jgi:UDP-glucose 4-epimerase
MAILVTGGAGYIDSHTSVELLNAGYEIIILDNFSNSKPESLLKMCFQTTTLRPLFMQS